MKTHKQASKRHTTEQSNAVPTEVEKKNQVESRAEKPCPSGQFHVPDHPDEKAVMEFCLSHAIPGELWWINYDKEITQERPELKLPATIGQINFSELIERLGWELGECAINKLHELQAAEEQALACVKVVAWLRKNGRL